jgi:molybdate transport system substrate-binding protein
MSDGRVAQGSSWVVPAHLHSPIRQDTILLTKGRDAPAAAALMRFLHSERARALIRSFGYAL